MTVDIEAPEGAQHDVRSAGKLAFSGTAAYLLLTLLTGAILSRALGPSGKGVFSALTTTPVVLAWFFQPARPTPSPTSSR